MTKVDDSPRILIPREKIQERVREMARQISDDMAGEEPVVVGVLTGAVFILGDLVRELNIPCKIDFLKASSYGTGKSSSGDVRLIKDIDIDVRGKPVILVEDIVDTGLTVKRLCDLIGGKSPSVIRICALIDKVERRHEDVLIDYAGFRVEKGFLVGYGMDFNENYRHLPDICTLD